MAQGIVVNGLPIMDENANGYFPNLDKYYQACVAGGRGCIHHRGAQLQGFRSRDAAQADPGDFADESEPSWLKRKWAKGAR